MEHRSNGFLERAFTIWRPSHYNGEETLGVVATQLDALDLSPAEKRRVVAEWVHFFSSGESAIRELQLVSRVPQELIDSLVGQTQLESLLVKWGPYKDVTSLAALRKLHTLRLGGATALQSLDPLLGLPNLTSLAVSEAHRVDGTAALAQLTTLTRLMFGNDSMGSDKALVLEDLTWVVPLRELRSLALPGTRVLSCDLSPLLELPHLETLLLPLRRDLRAQVFEFAQTSPVFEQVAREYEKFESWRTTPKR